MSEQRIPDENVDTLVEQLRGHDSEKFYVEYREASKQLATEIEVALRKAGWEKEPEVVSFDASIPDKPEVEIETTTREPERGVRVFINWLEDQDLSAKHNYNPSISAVAIHVDSTDN